MPIIANIVKPGTRKVEQTKEQTAKKSVLSLKAIHEINAKKNQEKQPSMVEMKSNTILEKPKRITSYQDTNQINIKKTSRYLEDLTNIGDN